MVKNICTLLILFSTAISNGQNIFLLKNTNPKAKDLKHNLNNTKDSLLLESETKILKVEIFNEDYENMLIVEDFKTQICLSNIPEGKFVIEVKLADKVIIFGLMRNDYSNDLSYTESLELDTTAEGKGMMLDEKLNVIKSSPNKSIAFILTRRKLKNHSTKNQKFFWTETRVNNKSGSSKTKKLVDKESVNRMILRHKQELNSDCGRLNELTVWEVYNTRKFMENQVLNPNFIYSSSTEIFNTTPYYTTTSKVQNL